MPHWCWRCCCYWCSGHDDSDNDDDDDDVDSDCDDDFHDVDYDKNNTNNSSVMSIGIVKLKINPIVSGLWHIHVSTRL